MPRIDLNVPFSEKDEAKQLGARWDADRKVWYVPDGVNPSAFKRWQPDEQQINLRSNSYYFAQSKKNCWKCGEPTSVFGFFLPAGYEKFEEDYYDVEDEDNDGWFKSETPTILCHVTVLIPSVEAQVKSFTDHYRIDYSKTINCSYWMNHCEACGMKQGDYEIFDEPGGAFYPLDERAASKIIRHSIAEPFGCYGNVIIQIGQYF